MKSASQFVFLAIALPALYAQPTAAFEVSTVKRSPDLASGGFAPQSASTYVGLHIAPQSLSAGRLNLKRLIQVAYDLNDFQITGGPAWIEKDYFDIAGKAAAPATKEQLLLMLRSLLTDRFQLEFHRDTKETGVLAMVLAKGGPKFKESRDGVICTECRMRHARPAELATLLSALVSLPSRDPATGAIIPHAESPVVDQTGLSGFYDIDFRPEPDQDIFAEIARQLGITLERRKVAVETFVIERAVAPSAN